MYTFAHIAFVVLAVYKQCTFEDMGDFRAYAILASKIHYQFHKAPKKYELT